MAARTTGSPLSLTRSPCSLSHAPQYRKSFKRGQFHLGPLSIPIGAIAVCWVLFLTVRGMRWLGVPDACQAWHLAAVWCRRGLPTGPAAACGCCACRCPA